MCVVIFCISFKINDVEHLFMYTLAIIISFGKCLLGSFPHFSIGYLLNFLVEDIVGNFFDTGPAIFLGNNFDIRSKDSKSKNK